MSTPAKGILLSSRAVAPGFAAALLLRGTFAAHDHELFNITANTSQAITIQTDSSTGGTVNSAIPTGGLAPTASSLFDNLDDVLALTNGTCSQVELHPTTGSCDDLDFRDALGPGRFTLALAGDPSLTRQEAGTSGSFCDLTTALGTTRTGNYAIATGMDSVLGPQPGSIFLPLAGALPALPWRRHSFNSR